jgi:hypothetical protein
MYCTLAVRSSISRGAVIGISIASTVVICLLLGYLLARCHRKRNERHSQPRPERVTEGPNAAVVPYPYPQTPDDPSVTLATGDKETTMFWRHQAPVLHAGPPLSAPQRKRQRARPDTVGEPVSPPLVPTAAAEREPLVQTPVEVQPLDIQQLLRRADSLSTAPGTQAADLRQRLAELGPIPEVLQALQDLLRNESAVDPDLPRYEEMHR